MRGCWSSTGCPPARDRQSRSVRQRLARRLSWLKRDIDPVHTEYRDDRFVAAMDREPGQSAFFTLAYVVRAVAPGHYVYPPATAEDMYRPERYRPHRLRRGRGQEPMSDAGAESGASGDARRPDRHFRPWRSRRLERAIATACGRSTSPRRGGSTVVVDRDGRLLRAFTLPDGRWRLPVTPDEVDPRYLALLIAYEDGRFWDHKGVDGRALLRAAWQWATRLHIVSGGSTLSMQVARILEPREERTPSRQTPADRARVRDRAPRRQGRRARRAI